MAKMSTKGLDEVAEDFKRLGEVAEPEFMDELLDVGAEEVKDAWDMIIREEGYVDTGEMRKSVGVAKGTEKGPKREIYPQGEVKRGKQLRGGKKIITTRNAEKAYILHYGNSNKLGTRFVDDVERIAEVKSYIAMQDVFNDYLKTKGLI